MVNGRAPAHARLGKDNFPQGVVVGKLVGLTLDIINERLKEIVWKLTVITIHRGYYNIITLIIYVLVLANECSTLHKLSSHLLRKASLCIIFNDCSDFTSKICELENASTKIPPNFVSVIPLNTYGIKLTYVVWELASINANIYRHIVK